MQSLPSVSGPLLNFPFQLSHIGVFCVHTLDPIIPLTHSSQEQPLSCNATPFAVPLLNRTDNDQVKQTLRYNLLSVRQEKTGYHVIASTKTNPVCLVECGVFTAQTQTQNLEFYDEFYYNHGSNDYV